MVTVALAVAPAAAEQAAGGAARSGAARATEQLHLTGPHTGLDSPAGIAIDSSGNVYVGDVYDNTINIYAPGATGDATPARVMTSSQLLGPYSLDFLPNGDLVACSYHSGRVLVFPAGASGETAPKRSIGGSATFLGLPRGCATDAAGNIYVADQQSDAVLVFGPTANGNANPIRGYLGGLTGLTQVVDVDVDTAGNIYALNGSGGGTVRVFTPGAGTTSPPNRVIQGPFTDPGSVAVDSTGAVYVGDGTYGIASGGGPMTTVNGPLYVYPAGANGYTTPTRIQPSWSTGQTYLDGIALDQANNIWVAGRGFNPQSNPMDGPGDAIRFAAINPPPASATRPSAVRKLQVRGAPGAKRFAISWKAPALPGGGELTYSIKIAAKKKVLLRAATHGTRLKVAAKRLTRKLAKASHGAARTYTLRVTITPTNLAGTGPAARSSFRVRVAPIS